jgi:hypothetical protein
LPFSGILPPGFNWSFKSIVTIGFSEHHAST